MRIALPLTVLLCLSCLSCAPLPVKEVTAVPGPPPVPEPVAEYSAALGTDFVRLAVDRTRGWARLNIVGRDGAPNPISARHLAATCRLSDGKVRQATFEPAVRHKGLWPTSRFELQRAWLRGSGALTLTVDVPLAGTRYRVIFECPESTGTGWPAGPTLVRHPDPDGAVFEGRPVEFSSLRLLLEAFPGTR